MEGLSTQDMATRGIVGLPRGGWGRRKREESGRESFEQDRLPRDPLPGAVASPLAGWWSLGCLSRAAVGPIC